MLAFGDQTPGIKTYRRGTHHTIAPEETIARLRPLMHEFGITRVANLTGLDRAGIPVVMVCRPNSRSSAVFHGKGLDISAAKASGLMEAIETWHAEHIQLPLRYGSFEELHVAFNLADVDGLSRIPGGRFHRNLRLLWVEGRDLIGGAPVWLPLETVHADCTMTGLPGGGCFSASTNGLASGNHLLEATSHALCEVIERDATSLWHQLHPTLQDRRRLDLATVDHETCRQLLGQLEEAELDIGVWDTTTDVGVPSFDCVVLDRTREIGHVGRGAGCHPTRRVALLRAVTEAVQVRTGYIVGSREDIRQVDYHARYLDEWNRRASSLLRPAEGMRDYRTLGSDDFDSFDDEVAWLLSRLTAAGVRQAIAVDLTRAAFDLPVVRVVVPGLEGADSLADYLPGPRAQESRARRP
ncbi:MAG TPA: YcaO-like family protein [Verrucomicrobiae bacterium]|jgi:YcaO-like protein with predicted kinase domain|nr:YcaO-like family protein [Verrucomicrobiae bacterium]